MASPSQRIAQLASKAMTPVNMKTLLDSGTGRLLGNRVAQNVASGAKVTPHSQQEYVRKLARLQIASFLQHELPIRFAHRIRDLENLPHGLNKMPSIKFIQDQYFLSGEELFATEGCIQSEIENGELSYQGDDQEIRKRLITIYQRHSDTLIEIAKGLKEFIASDQGQGVLGYGKKDLSDITEIHSFLDRFFISRIGIRVLIGHYLEICEQTDMGDYDNNYVGIICPKTSPAEVAMSAVEDAKYMCERQYGDAPNVEMLGRTDLTFSYVPSHLYYILFEVIKNSMRAVVEHHGVGNPLPEIRIVIADGEENEDVAIKVSDLGGGIPRSIMNRIFSYLFTTASPVNINLEGTPTCYLH